MYYKIFNVLIRVKMFRLWLDRLIANNKHVRLIAKPDSNGYSSYLRLSKDGYMYYYRGDGWVGQVNYNDMLSLIGDFLKYNKVQLRKTQFDYKIHSFDDKDTKWLSNIIRR